MEYEEFSMTLKTKSGHVVSIEKISGRYFAVVKGGSDEKSMTHTSLTEVFDWAISQTKNQPNP